MTLTIRRHADRGHANHGWLDTFHTFSFAEYRDPAHVGFRALRVINEDRVQPGQGFGTHGHQDMEILTYVLDGALEHGDSMGNGAVIRPGEVQRMTAGTGVTHSEFNHSQAEEVHFLQIWIEPEALGLAPGYEQQVLDFAAAPGGWCPIAAPPDGGGAVRIHQDVRVFAARLTPDATVDYALPSGRHAWLQVVRGAVQLNSERLETGDGAAVSDEPRLEVRAAGPAEVLLFDLA